MELPADVRARLFDAGASALRFNAPMGDERAAQLIKDLSPLGPRRVVDLGCGRGELARLLAAGLADATVIGVDADDAAIAIARRVARASGLEGRIRFEVADAARWSGPVDAAVCVGASHVFGGPAGMLSRLADLVSNGAAVVGDVFWESDPDPWCDAAFGVLPRGVDGLVATAEATGWTVVAAHRSTGAEWDAFEAVWVAGVRSVGTPTADAFADQREREYREHYRGVLGFGWLVLSR